MSKKFTLQFVLLSVVLMAHTHTMVQADTLNISFSNVSSDAGQINFQVFSSPAQFAGDDPAIASLSLQAQALTAAISINDLPSGDYGIRVMHDINGNGELDTNFVGIPKEPYGFSNNAKGNFGPPKWKDIVFKLDASADQVIDLSQ